MAVYGCPKGHQSTEPDFCSECGSKIQGAPGTAPASPALTATAATFGQCPDCGAPRVDTGSNFCEVCGYNFATGTHGNVPDDVLVAPEPPPVATPPVEPPPVAIVPSIRHWTVVAAVDASLRDPEGPELPTNTVPVVIQLDKPVNLIGRTSEKRGIHPEISLDIDDGISHRHALLTCGEDGVLTLRDIGSSNGTRLNGADVKALEDIALHDGDQITLGRWTRLSVKGQ